MYINAFLMNKVFLPKWTYSKSRKLLPKSLIICTVAVSQTVSGSNFYQSPRQAFYFIASLVLDRKLNSGPRMQIRGPSYIDRN
jgi:hypothetical protein